ncbi:MAG: SPOR domain-containing protein [Deltaproteobacteria bacterium]|nr:SPOR domain-containing protein [Deltaproteobacteria bacterium]
MISFTNFRYSEKRPGSALISFLLVLSLSVPCNFLLKNAFAQRAIYSIQLGAFCDADNAREMTEDLIKLGHHSFYREEFDGGNVLYRVYIEKYATRAEAKKEAEILENLDLISGYIIKELPDDSKHPVKKQHADAAACFCLHVESYNEKANAEKRVDEMKEYAHRAFYLEEEVSGGKWYRIYIGDFSSEEDARQKGAELKNKGIINYFKPSRLPD